VDLTSINETGNFCLKACANPFEPVDGDLTSSGSLTFTNLKPGERREASVLIENDGPEMSSLCWEIGETPEWGRWTIQPAEQYLKPHHGPVELVVTVTAPFEKNADFSVTLSIVNINNASDVEVIDIQLTTMKHGSIKSFFETLLTWIEDFVPI